MKRALLIVAAAVLLIGTLAVLRMFRTSKPASAPQKAIAAKKRSGHYIPPSNPGPVADREAASRAYSDARLRTTYKNYRTAVATGNDRLRQSLRPSLDKHMSTILGWAESDLATATRPNDLEIARKTLESLRN